MIVHFADDTAAGQRAYQGGQRSECLSKVNNYDIYMCCWHS